MRRLGEVDCLLWDLCDGEWNGSNAAAGRHKMREIATWRSARAEAGSALKQVMQPGVFKSNESCSALSFVFMRPFMRGPCSGSPL